MTKLCMTTWEFFFSDRTISSVFPSVYSGRLLVEIGMERKRGQWKAWASQSWFDDRCWSWIWNRKNLSRFDGLWKSIDDEEENCRRNVPTVAEAEGVRTAFPRKLILLTETWKREGCPAESNLTCSKKPSMETKVLFEGIGFFVLYLFELKSAQMGRMEREQLAL